MTQASRSADAGLAPLYAIADSGTWPLDSLPELMEDWAKAGIRCLQLRAKHVGERRLLSIGRRCRRRLADYDVRFWINDSVRVARDLDATGVHLGQADRRPGRAREVLGAHQLIGQSTHDLAQVLIAGEDPAVDVVAVGPIFKTKSKVNSEPIVGLSRLSRMCLEIDKPVIAIGGIEVSDLKSVFAAGVNSVAMISALQDRRDDPIPRPREILARVKEAVVFERL